MLRIANNRASQIAAVGGALIMAVSEFGVELTDGQEQVLFTLLFAVVGLLAGRNITQAERRPPPTRPSSWSTPPAGTTSRAGCSMASGSPSGCS